MNFQEYLSPCTHAIVACRYEVEDPFDYVLWHYSVKAYRETYQHFLLLISVENLASTDDVLLPKFKKQRGRPLTKRIRNGAWKRKELHCSNCKGTGHNIRKCRYAPAWNGRQQRARDREESSLDSDSNSGSNISSDSGDSNDSDKCDDARMHEAEIKLYDERMAKAHKIIERRKREWALEDRDGDRDRDESELSVLASSQFDGMEGIASEGIASEGVTSRDTQGAITQDTTSSPRRTRSGKFLSV